MLNSLLTLLLAGATPNPQLGLANTGASTGPKEVYIRVVDTGPGLCVVIRAPGPAYMVYDAGHWVGKECLNAAKEIVGSAPIDYMIISHSDADHFGQAALILNEFDVRNMILQGHDRGKQPTWKKTMKAIAKEVVGGASVRNLQSSWIRRPEYFRLGHAKVSLIGGWREWKDAGPEGDSEYRNVVSIVAKIEYQGHSVLLAGDTIGRRRDDPDTACKDAEALMANWNDAGRIRLRSDVIVAPHHGGNNASSACFIAAVDPRYVVFSAGHAHGHPRQEAVQRYLDAGVPAAKILRTDRGDDEGDNEWGGQRIKGCTDRRGDDDIEIVLPRKGTVRVEYKTPGSGC